MDTPFFVCFVLFFFLKGNNRLKKKEEEEKAALELRFGKVLHRQRMHCYIKLIERVNIHAVC